MVDEERVTRLLTRIREDLAALHRAGRPDADRLLTDDVLLDAVKYRFVTAIEGCVRVAQHLLASEGWGVPQTNAASFRELARNQVLTEPVADRLSRAVGFHDVLVHQYAEVDDQRVVHQLGELGDIEEFVRQVDGWVVEQQ